MFSQTQGSPPRIVAAIRRLGTLSLFRRDVPVTKAWDAIGWWETRRVPYNLIVGGAGILTCVVISIFAAVGMLVFGADFGSPLSGLIGILIYGIMATICFTFGWVAELVVWKAWPQQVDRFAIESFSLGLVVSVLLTLTPGILSIVVGIFFLLSRLRHFVHNLGLKAASKISTSRVGQRLLLGYRTPPIFFTGPV
jgi:hypothetical protein